MPRYYVPKGVLQMDRTNLEKAFYYRIETGCSLRQAARQFDVAMMTLQDAFNRSRRKSDGKTFVPMQKNFNKVFSLEQENRIVEYTKKLARMFYGLNVVEFLKLVYTYAIAVGSKSIPKAWEKGRSATRDWYYGFMKRHPTMSLKLPEGMSIARITAFNRTNVDLFFEVYTQAMDKYSFTPDRILNVDESSLTTVMKPVKVLCEKGKPVASVISRERGTSMTFVGIITAAGNFIPPVFIIPRKRWNESFMRGTIHGSEGLLHQNGWMNGELFLQTLQHIQRKTYCSPDNKILLIMDNAECHMNIHAIEYAIQNGIVIVTLPPHTTAKLQPLDVSVFGPFKSHLRSLQKDFHLMNPNRLLTEHHLPELASKAWIKACTPANVLSGFAATGIWPVDRNIFPDDAFAGAEVTEQPPPPEVVAEEQSMIIELDGSRPASANSSLSPSPTPTPSEMTTPLSIDIDSPGPSGNVTPGPSGSVTPGPSGIVTPGPSGNITPGPSGNVGTPGPSGSVTPGPSGNATPGPSGLLNTPVRSASITLPTSSDSGSCTDLSPEVVRPFPKAAARPVGKGRKRVKACILTENEEAIIDMRLKEDKKKRAAEKKEQAGGKRRKTPKTPVMVAEDDSDVDEPAVILDDSSEYSAEEVEESVGATEASYPFKEKEPEVDDFILVALRVEEGPQEGKIVHYVGKLVGIEEGGRQFLVSFLRIKSPFARDLFIFPPICDETKVDREQCQGVLTTRKGSTQRLANVVHICPPLYGFEMR